MTASQLHSLLVSTLARTAGGTQRHWRILLGPVRLHDPVTHAHCNWSVQPSGEARENAAAEALMDAMRLAHPLVTAD